MCTPSVLLLDFQRYFSIIVMFGERKYNYYAFLAYVREFLAIFDGCEIRRVDLVSLIGI